MSEGKLGKRWRWDGDVPTHCHMCRGTLGKVFYDDLVRRASWALMCHRCWRSLGAGIGHKYDRKTLERVK